MIASMRSPVFDEEDDDDDDDDDVVPPIIILYRKTRTYRDTRRNEQKLVWWRGIFTIRSRLSLSLSLSLSRFLGSLSRRKRSDRYRSPFAFRVVGFVRVEESGRERERERERER